VPAPVLNSAERLVRRQLEHVLERKLRAAEFVHRVAEEQPLFRPRSPDEQAVRQGAR